MRKENNQVTVMGVGFLGLLTLLFIALKLTNNIDWPWIWVLSPLWIPFAILIFGLALYFVIVLVVSVFKSLGRR